MVIGKLFGFSLQICFEVYEEGLVVRRLDYGSLSPCPIPSDPKSLWI